MPIHNVDMYPIRTGALGFGNLLSEPGEVRGQNGRCQSQFAASKASTHSQ